jgi:hypothetical protein
VAASHYHDCGTRGATGSAVEHYLPSPSGIPADGSAVGDTGKDELMANAVVGTRIWTEGMVRSLGMTTDIETAGEILGVGRTKAYAWAKAGLFPVKVIRVGRLYKVSVPALLGLLGVGEVGFGSATGR